MVDLSTLNLAPTLLHETSHLFRTSEVISWSFLFVHLRNDTGNPSPGPGYMSQPLST